MATRPAYILACEVDVRDPRFPAQCMAWTNQMRSEIQEIIALTNGTIATSKALIKQADRLLALR